MDNLCTIWLKITPNLRGKTQHGRRAKLAVALGAAANFRRRGCRFFVIAQNGRPRRRETPGASDMADAILLWFFVVFCFCFIFRLVKCVLAACLVFPKQLGRGAARNAVFFVFEVMCWMGVGEERNQSGFWEALEGYPMPLS